VLFQCFLILLEPHFSCFLRKKPEESRFSQFSGGTFQKNRGKNREKHVLECFFNVFQFFLSLIFRVFYVKNPRRVDSHSFLEAIFRKIEEKTEKNTFGVLFQCFLEAIFREIEEKTRKNAFGVLFQCFREISRNFVKTASEGGPRGPNGVPGVKIDRNLSKTHS